MFGLGLIELVALVLLLVGVGLLVRARLSDGPVSVRREWRLVQLTRLVGVLAGWWVAGWTAETGRWGLGPALAPAAFGLVVLVAVGLGETVVRPPAAEGARSASLRPRRVTDYLPRQLTRVVTMVTAITFGLLLLTSLTASRDPGTGAMRALRCGSGDVSGTATPWPGTYYSLPIAGLLLAVLVVAAVAARQVVRRPRGLAPQDLDDDALRRRSLDVVVAAVGLTVALTLGGVAGRAAGALSDLGALTKCAPAWSVPAGGVLTVVAVACIGLSLWCLLELALGRAARRPAARPRVRT